MQRGGGRDGAGCCLLTASEGGGQKTRLLRPTLLIGCHKRSHVVQKVSSPNAVFCTFCKYFFSAATLTYTSNHDVKNKDEKKQQCLLWSSVALRDFTFSVSSLRDECSCIYRLLRHLLNVPRAATAACHAFFFFEKNKQPSYVSVLRERMNLLGGWAGLAGPHTHKWSLS